MSSEHRRADLDPRIFTENVLALLDRSEAIKDEAERKTLRKQVRDKEIEEDRAFLEYTSRVTKVKQAAQVKEALQPFSAEVASNYESINAMLGIHNAALNEKAATKSSNPRSTAAAAQEDLGFDVDTDFATNFNGGMPMKAPPAGPEVDRTALAIEMLTRGGDIDLDDFETDSPHADASWSAKTPSAAIGRRTVAKRDAGPVDPLKTAAGEHIRALLAPPPQTAVYAHEIAHIFNMLDSNNIILIATEEIPRLTTEGQPEYKNTLVTLSPTNGYRLRRHLETPAGESNIVYSSQGWTVRRELLSAILQGRVDFEHVARMHVALEQTFCDLKRNEALLKKKDQELARTKTACESLIRSTEGLVAKSRLRRALLVQLAVAMRSALQETESKQQADTMRHRGAVLADFIMRHDSNAARDEDAAVGGALRSPQANTTAVFSSFNELQQALNAYDESRSKMAIANDTMTSNNGNHLSSWAEPSNALSFIPPALDFSLISPTNAAPGGQYGSLLAGTIDSNTGAALANSSQAHESLLRALHKKVEIAQRRRNFERRMELMERLALEGEDVMSSVNTIFRFGETGFARVRDLLNSIPSHLLQGAARAASSLHHVPLAMEGTSVICPCCKFEFDPSKPAGFYREMILQRQKKARDAMASKQAAAVTASQLHGGKKSGGKSVVAGNHAGEGKRGYAEPSEDQMFAVMALQESLDEAQKQNKQLDEKVAELEAGVEVANLNALAAQQRAQALQEEFTKVTDDLRQKASKAETALADVTKAKDAAEATAKHLKVKLSNMEKAAEQAMEELELIHASDRRIADYTTTHALEKGITDGKAAWEDVAKHYYRRFEEVSKQVRRLGGEVLETFDVYSGPDTPPLMTVSKLSQYEVRDIGLKPITFEDASMHAFPRVAHRESQRTPRPAVTFVSAETQTVGVHVINQALLNSEKNEAQQAEWRTKQGDDVQTVLMRRDIYNLLLKSSDHSDKMRDYIRDLEKKDKEDQERHAKELSDQAKAAEREIKALRKDLEAKREALEKRDKEAQDRHAKEMSALLEAAGKASRDALDKKAREEQERRNRELSELQSQSQRDLLALRESLKGQQQPPIIIRETSPPVPPSSPPGKLDDSSGFFYDYDRPTGPGRTITRRVNAFTTVELEELEAAVRRELESQYLAFTIPLPMLLALLVESRAQVRHLVSEQEKRGRQREERINKAIHVSRVLLGGDLGVSDDAPSWYGHTTSPSFGRSVDHDSALEPPGPLVGRGYRVLEVKEFPPLEPSVRDPRTGTYVRDASLHHAGFLGSAGRPGGAGGGPKLQRGSPTRNRNYDGGMLMVTSKGGKTYLILEPTPEAEGEHDDEGDPSGAVLQPNVGETEAAFELRRLHHAYETIPQRVAKLSVDGSQLPQRDDAPVYHRTLPGTNKMKQVDALRRQQDDMAYRNRTRSEPSLGNILLRAPLAPPALKRPLEPREFDGDDVGLEITSVLRSAPSAPRNSPPPPPASTTMAAQGVQRPPPALHWETAAPYPHSRSAEPYASNALPVKLLAKRNPQRGSLMPLH